MPGTPIRTHNPLLPLATLLAEISDRLQDDQDGRSPRWVRLARAREIRNKPPFGPLVIDATGLLCDFVTALHRFTFAAEDLLLHVDPTNALLELALELGRAMVAPELGAALDALLETDAPSKALKSATESLDLVRDTMRFVPGPADLRALGRQVYSLMGIPGLGRARPGLLDAREVGPLRALSWAFERPLSIRAPGREAVPVTLLGCRPVGDLSKGSSKWKRDSTELVIYEARETADIAEIVSLLDALGYTDPPVPDKAALSPALSRRLELFQRFNDLPLSGEPDVHTVHRLLNLDYASRNVARARPFDARELRAMRPRSRRDEEAIALRPIGGWIPLPHGPEPFAARKGADISLPEEAESAWIPHEKTDSFALIQGEQKAPLGCAFVRVEEGEGGALRSRSGEAGTEGDISGIYRWIPLNEAMREMPAGARLELQIELLQRCPVGQLLEQGRVVLGVVAAEGYDDGAVSLFREEALLATAWSGWWPNRPGDVDQWSRRATPKLSLPGPLDAVGAICVGLYGIKNAKGETAAEFDEILLRWAIVRDPAMGEELSYA